jgi:hypothetical protein
MIHIVEIKKYLKRKEEEVSIDRWAKTLAKTFFIRRFDKLIYLPQNIIIMDKQNNKKEKVYNDPVLTVIKLSGNSILADSGPCDWNQIS